jgi:hypothetical protein
MSLKAVSSFGLWSLNKVSTVTICKTSFGILNPESITTLDADASSAEALQFRALATSAYKNDFLSLSGDKIDPRATEHSTSVCRTADGSGNGQTT